MKNILTKAAPQGRSKLLLAGATILTLMSFSVVSQAHADNWHGRGHGRDWHRHYYRPHYVAPPPAYVYAPPPPPVAYYPQQAPVSTGINLVLPLHFR